MSVERVSLVRVPTPESEAELVTIVDTLEAFGIPCFVDNSGGGSRLRRGPVRKPPVVMVPQERLTAALELIRVHRRARATHGDAARRSWSGYLRALLRLVVRCYSTIAPRHSSPPQRDPLPVPAEKLATVTETCRSGSNRWFGDGSR
jgi:hypothetical protein